MDAEKRQQALDSLRNALGRLEQSGFDIVYNQGASGCGFWIWNILVEPAVKGEFESISNHTLRLKEEK